MEQPPRPADAPFFAAHTWHQALRQGALLSAVGLWLLVQAIPGLVSLLELAPTPPAMALAVMAAAIALLLVTARSSSPAVP